MYTPIACPKCGETIVIHNINIGTCDCCESNKLTPLYAHHWYEPPSLKYHEHLVCPDCNGLLTAGYIWGLPNEHTKEKRNHVLPRWEFQAAFIKAIPNHDEGVIRQQIRETYKRILPDNWVGHFGGDGITTDKKSAVIK